MKKRYQTRNRIILSFILIVAVGLLILVYTTGCSNSDNDNETGASQVTGTITSEDGGVFETGQAKVEFPAGSVLEDVTVSGMPIFLEGLPEDLEPLSSVHQISISKDELYAAHSATVSFKLGGNTDKEGVCIYHSEDGVNWNKLESTVEGDNVSSAIPGFSYFMAAKSNTVETDSLIYTLKVVNNSSYSTNACVFQYDSDWGNNVMPITWFSRNLYPATTVLYQWSRDYGYCWSETGMIKPGVVFNSSQLIGGNLTSYNKITFTTKQGYGNLVNLTFSGSPGTMTIQQDNTIPNYTFATGIAMSSSPICATQSMPNFTNRFSFNNTKYYITMGNYIRGEILDINEIYNKAEIDFPPGVYSMTATYNADGTWTIVPTN